MCATLYPVNEQIGEQIRELRTTLKGQGISQKELAEAVSTTANKTL